MTKKLKYHLAYILTAIVPIIIFLSPNLDANQLVGEKFLNFLTFIPYISFILIGYLGYKLNQTRILFTGILLLATYHFMLNPDILKVVGMGKIRLRQILSLGIPLGLSVLFAMKESTLWSRKTAIRVGLLILPIIAFSIFFIVSPNLFDKLTKIKFIPSNDFVIPQISYISLLVLSIISSTLTESKIKPFLNATLISLIPFYTASYIGIKNGVSLEFVITNNIFCFSVISLILLHALYQMYWERVYIDELTSIPNRRALDEKMQNLSGDYSIAMVDIDHFKKFNDNYGHDEGDNVLRLVAKTIESVLGDRVFRYGGEEFCVLFRGANPEESFMLANKARRKLEDKIFTIRSRASTNGKKDKAPKNAGKKVKVTISIGIAGPDKANTNPTMVIKKADTALYKAKENGRNCVIIA
ncbi:MAG: GGDEF domain-containing protein [Bacteriovoracaceae bacterium]|nr:GGDEF domain-containing protein [Bacteriovoracaceae bacterium]